MPSSKNGGNIEFGVSFKTDSSLDKLKKSLQDLQKVKLGDFKGSADDLDRVKETAQKVESILSRAFNPTLNTTNISTFNNELKKSNLTVEQIKSDFSQFGKEGQLAFSRMASSLLTTNLKLKETNSLIDSMGKTMINTVKWGIASSIMNTFTQSVQGAFQYVQSLEKSLTNIRIVTGDSTEKMAQFAEQANKSAQTLGRSTLDYSKASLTFYQQGLNDEDVQARTEATLKAQNITGAGTQMADYLTSVWNGYKVANEEAELYVDKLAAVADSSASDMSQLAIAMSKVASTANNMGVDIDQLNAQIATVVATTRQAPQSVGTAFKTIYTRMNDIQAGSEDAEISLGRYSGKMAELGFNVLDATGHLRDTGDVMTEIGQRWEDLTKEQQVYLAQTMGGQRQVNQLMALFDNWTTYSELLNTSLESEGTLAEKNARYMDSLGAKMEQLGAAGERVKDSLIDTDSMKGIVDILTNVTNLVATLFESIGGGNNVLLAFGSVATQVFGGTISKEIAHMIEGFQNAKVNAEILKNDIALTKTFENSQGENTKGLQFVQKNMEELQKYYSILDESAINEQKNIIDRIGVLKDEQTQLQQNQNAVREYAERIGEVEESRAAFNDSQNFSNTNMELGNLIESARILKQQYDILKNSGFTNDEELEKFKTKFEGLLEGSEKLGINVDKVRQAFNSGNWAEIGVSKIFDEAIQKGELFSTTINNSGSALEDTTNKINNLTSIMQSKQNSFETLFNVNNAVKFASTVGQIGSIMTSITNLGSIIKNEDLSASEKLAKVLTNIGFLLPMIINTSKNISQLLGITNALTERRLILERQITKEKQKQEKQEKLAQKKALFKTLSSKDTLTSEQFENLKTLKKEIPELEQSLNVVQKEALKAHQEAAKLKDGITTAFSAASTSVSNFITVLGSIAGPLLAIGAVVAVGYTIYKVYNSAADAAKQASENAEKAKQTYDELKNSYKDLTTALEDYHGAKDALSELVRGTEEWYDKVNELNDKVLQLLQKFPELAEYITTTEDGLLQISDNGLEEVRKTYRQRVYTAGMANANLQEKSYQAGRNADITKQGRRIYGSFGIFGGKDVMEAVLSAVQKNGTGILGDEDALKTAVANEGIDLNKDQIDATVRNTQQIIKLNSSLEAEKTQVNALKDSLIKTNLINEEVYRNSQNKEAFSDIYSKGLKQATASLGEQFYKKVIIDEYGNEQQVLDRQKILDTYTQLTGKELKQSLFGGLSAETQNGQFEKTTFEAIKSYVEQSQANVDTAKLLEETANRLTQAEKNFINQDDRTKNLLFNSGLVGGFDKVNTNQLSEGDINRLQGLNQKNTDLADYLGLSQQDVTKGLEQLKVDIQTGVADFIEGIEETSIKETLKSLQSKNTYLSKELAQAIAQNLEDGFNMGGNDAKKTLSDFYQKLSDEQLQSAIKVAESYDLTTGSVQDFKRTLQEAGVNTSNLSDQIIEAFLETERKIQNIKAYSRASDPTYISSATTTLATAKQVDSGEKKLSDKERQQFNEGLEKLTQTYPELERAANILKQQWLEGTSQYKQALQEVQDTILQTSKTIIDQNPENAQSIRSTFITTIQDAQMALDAYETGLLETGTKLNDSIAGTANTLSELDDLLGYGAISGEGFGQALQTVSDKEAASYGIDTDKYQAYVDLLQRTNEAYEENEFLARRVAIANMRISDGTQDLIDNWKNWTEAIQDYKDSGDILALADDWIQLRDTIADLFNADSEAIDMLGPDFVANNWDKIQAVKNGVEGAWEEMNSLMSQTLILNAYGVSDFSQLDQDIQDAYTAISELDGTDVSIVAGMEGTDDILNAFQTIADGAHWTSEQAQAAFSQMGYDVEVEAKDPNMKQDSEETQYYVPPTYTMTSQPFSLGPFGTTGSISYPTMVAGGHYESAGGGVKESYEPGAYSIKSITSNGKSSGGKISRNTAGKSGNRGSGKGGGGKKGGGGGGSKAKEPNKAKGATNKADRYRNNTVKANKLANSMTKLNKQQERMTGKDLLRNLEKQLSILEKQKDVIKEKLGLQRDEQTELANNLKKYGATFDSDGTLNNYFKTHAAIMKQYNDKVAKWNQMSGEQQQKNKDYLNNAKQIMDQALKDLQRYDKLQQEITKTQQERLDKIQQQIDKQVQIFDLKIQAQLDLSKAKRDWNEFQKNVIKQVRDDDILGLNKFRFADIASYYNNAGTGSIQNLTQRLQEALGNVGGLFSGTDMSPLFGNVSMTDREAQLKKVQEIFDSLKDQMEDFKELTDEIKESIFDTIDTTQDAFDEQMDEYEYIGDLIDHNMKITEMMFGDEAYDKMAKYYDRIEENNNAQLDFLTQQKDLWYGRMMEEQARMNQLAKTHGTDSNLYKEANDRFEEYKKHWMDSVKDLNSTVEDAIENIFDKYNNTINDILVKFELGLGNGKTLDDIEDEWDILNEQADQYFDKINAAYQIDKLENAFNDAIDQNNGDLAAQQSLNDLMEQQLAYLRDKEKLTQYDVDRANTLLQIEMKRLALEQSRSNKNKLRLRRDSQGNYTYQYTADTESINKAEQELADAQNSLYNSDKAAYVDNLSAIQKSAQNIKSKLEDIWTDENLSKEEKLQKSYELEKYYGDQINNLLADNATIRNNLIQSSTEELAKIYGISLDQFRTLSDEQQTNILKDLIPQAGSYLSQLTQGLIGQGGIGTIIENAIKDFLNADDEKINSLAEIEKNGQISFEDIISDTTTVIKQAEQLLDDNDKLINSYEQQIVAVQNTINAVNQLIDKYDKARQAAENAAKAANNFINLQNMEIAGTSRKTENTAQSKNDSIYTSAASKSNSYEDISDYTPYQSNWHSSDFTAMFGSSGVNENEILHQYNKENNINDLSSPLNNNFSNVIPVDNKIQSSISPLLFDTIKTDINNIVNNLQKIVSQNDTYYSQVLTKAKDIEQAVITNQTVHIDADFPNAKDVSSIIQAIQNLTLVAAQKANHN